MDSSNCVTNLLGEYPDWEGARVLQLLIQHPYTDIYASVVELCLKNTIPPPEAENLRYHLAPIKMTDEATLKAVKKRLNQLIAVASHSDATTLTPIVAHDSNPANVPVYVALERDATAEIRALTQYIKETTLPTGTIKCFNDDDTKAYRRQAAAISRLLNQAIKDGHHEAVAIVKANLKKGKIMRWETL
ncbi:MAG: hypothetical protein PHO32_03690 [Candidatus Cloacimonetes bacterium]|nr:hypothetical protein [Candidatus Cloacimonadota bacterium]